MERFLTIGGRTVDEKFPCIVCSLETSSVDELHNHQKYRHTSEELSLSVICLVHYIYLKNESMGSSGGNRVSSLLSENEKNDDYCPRAGDEKQANNSAGTSSLFNDLKTTIISSWEIELGRVREISDETFLNGVQGICKDLEGIERERPTQVKRGRSSGKSEDVVKKRKEGRKPGENRKGETSLSGIEELCSAVDYSCRKQRNEPKQNLRRLQSFTEAFKSVRNVSMMDHRAQGIPLLQNEAANFSCNQNPEQMPVLEPHLYIEQLLRPEFE